MHALKLYFPDQAVQATLAMIHLASDALKLKKLLFGYRGLDVLGL